jgi:hypothetical protein
MKYFRVRELVALHSVSEKTIRNWIDAARNKRLALELCLVGGRTYIQDNEHNHAVLEELVHQGRKYKNKRSRRLIKPRPEFYQTFSPEQVHDIINELDKYRLLPAKYKYFGEGGLYWGEYLKELSKDGKPNLVTNTTEVLNLNLDCLDAQTRAYRHVNIVNLCVGNSISLCPVLKHFNNTGKLRRFITVDLSPTMLDISAATVNEVLGSQIETEKYIRDLSHERFGDILVSDSFGSDGSETINLIFLIAGPLVNFNDPQDFLKNAYGSMRKEDLLITTTKRDTESTRSFFNFDLKDSSGYLNPQDGLLFKMLNIDEAFFEVKRTYDEVKHLRSIYAILNRDLSLSFEMDNFSQAIELEQGQALPIWWSWHHTDEDLIRRFTTAGFEIKHLTRSLDNQLNMLIAHIRPPAANSYLLNPQG